jgi:hypothetical protein
LISIFWSRDYRAADLAFQGESIGHLVLMPSGQWAMFGNKAFRAYPTADAAIDSAKAKIRKALDGSNLKVQVR